MQNDASLNLVIGLISDTHGLLRPEAVEALKGSDYILHAGDVGNPYILDSLRTIAPVTAIRGNVDRGPDWHFLAETETVELGGHLIYMLHDRQELSLNPRTAGMKAVIYGHTHKPDIEEHQGVWFINPGSAGRRRFTLPVSVGKITIREGYFHPEIIELDID